MEEKFLETCEDCWKPLSICVCADMKPVNNTIPVLVLQHPQESRNPLNTARLISLQLTNSSHRVGLSWGSFPRVMDFDKNKNFPKSPKDWVVLYLGSLKESQNIKGDYEFRAKPEMTLKRVKGIILLDGNWKQSKTLWWRNSWLLKVNRILLNVDMKSQFNQFRKQPRKNSLSSVEALLYIQGLLNEKQNVTSSLSTTYEKFLTKL